LLNEQLYNSPLDMDEIGRLLRDCYALGGQFDAIRLNAFLGDRHAAEAVSHLVLNFPRSDGEAAKRIDAFVERAVRLGFKDATGGEHPAGAALLASVLLTTLVPKRFVEYRHKHWAEFAKSLDYPMPEAPGYGEAIIQSSHFARFVCETKTFKRHWKDFEPLWALAGICWIGKCHERPTIPDPHPEPPLEDEVISALEGAKQQQMVWHRKREQRLRNQKIKLAMEQHGRLRCEVPGCGFDYFEVYGKVGKDYAHVHHCKPLGNLDGAERMLLKDLAIVCANCHAMIHRGGKCRPVKNLIQAN